MFLTVINGKIGADFLQIFVVNVKLITVMKDIKLGESWKIGNEAFIYDKVC